MVEVHASRVSELLVVHKLDYESESELHLSTNSSSSFEDNYGQHIFFSFYCSQEMHLFFLLKMSLRSLVMWFILSKVKMSDKKGCQTDSHIETNQMLILRLILYFDLMLNLGN